MDYAEAADGMTVALRGFKMGMEDAARVTDVYSKVAAVTASDSQELIEAMSKTASSAASVGSGFEETTAMLAVMIEATREAPTNIGSAMKSIISRYGEMTKGMSVDAEGEEIVFNKVDAALQSVGVSMKDATGQFREFDEVIYELASKWESLDSLSQRYVATVFAGNRQQSRFLALMSNYDRLVEVTENAENSEDAGLLQYSKTLDSLETKLNSVKTSFQQFYMNILNGDTFKGLLDVVNDILSALNKLPKLETVLGIGGAIISIKKFSNSIVDGLFGIFSKVSKGGSVKDTLFGGTKAGGSAIKNFFKKRIQKDGEVEEKAGQKQIQQKEEKRVEAKELTVESLKLQTSDARAYVKETAESQSIADKDYSKAFQNRKDAITQNNFDKYQLLRYKKEADETEARAKAQRTRAEREQQLADKANNQQSKKYHQQQADIANTLAAEEDKKVAKANAKVIEQKKKVVESDKKVAEANEGLTQQTERQKQASKESEKARRALSKSEHDLQQAESQAKLYNTANAIGTIGADVLSGAGIGLTLAGVKTVDSNINLSKKLSAAGAVASVGGQITSLAAQIHPLAGAVTALGAAAVAVGAAIFTTASDLEIAQQEFDNAKAASEEADIERAEKQNRATVLDSSLTSLKNLEEAQWDSAEAQEAFIETQNNLAASYPELITAYDSAGNAIIDISNAEAQLAAIRKQGAAAALAATEAEIAEKNAELNLNWTKQREAGEATETTNTDNTAENFLLFASGRMGIRDSLTGDIKERYENFIKTYGEMTFDEITFALENSYKDLKEIFFPEGYESYEEAIVNVVNAEDYETYVLERTQRMQEAQALNQTIIGLEKARIGDIATIALEDFAIGRGDYLGYAAEFDSAAALIKEQLVNQYIGDDGRIDSTALGVTAEELYDKETGRLSAKAISLLSGQAKSQAEKYQSYYDAIESLGQADEFEEFVSQAKLGKFSTSYAKEQLKEFVDGKEQSEFYTDYWASIEDSIKEQREQFINFIEDKDSRIIEIPEELTNMSEELPAFLLTNIRSTIKRIESQIKDNKITESQGEAFVESYNRFIQAIYSENNSFTKAQQDEIANLLSEADLSSVTGIYDFVETLKNAGFQEIVGSLEIDTLVKNSATNLVTEFENLQSTIISNLDSLAEALSSASEGMELSEALTMAEKLGVSVSDFKFKNGKFFYEDYNKIVEAYLKDYTKLEEQLFGENSVLSKMKDAAGSDLFTQFTSTEQIDNIKLLLNGSVNSSDELERQSAVDALAVLNQYGTQYLDWIKLTENEGKNFSDFMSVYVQEEINAFNAQKEKWQTWLLENSLTEQEIARTEVQNLLSKTTGFTHEELSTLSTELGINTADFFTKQADGTYNTTFDNIVTILNGTRQDIVTELMYSIESDMKNLKDSAGSLGEKIGSEHGGFGLEVSDIWELYGEQLGDNFDEAYTALYDYLQAGDMGEEFAEAIEYYTGGKVSKNDALKQYEEYVRGLTRGTEEYTKTFFEYKMKLLTGEMEASEVESMSDSDLRTDLKEYIDSIDEWATLTLEQRMAEISSLLMEDDTLTESERRSELEKQWESQLKETEAYQNIDESRRKKEIENIIRETGGKDLTETQLAQIRAVYGASIEAIATDSGWTITGKIPSSFVDEQKRFYSDVANSAAEGVKDLLSSMAEGTLTGAAIQDYFEEHNIEIDYAKAEELANGTMDALLETIVSSLSAQGIDISDRMEEIMAAIMDAILESISSGISSLGSGLEGTLGAADYQSLAKKHDLTGIGTTRSSKGIRLGAADQQKLISKMFLEAQNAGLSAEFGDQLWEVWRDSTEDAIDGYTAIEKEIARVKSEHEKLTREALAYVEALQQARAAAMFDENAAEFAFMEQDAVNELTKNFDKFVDNIDKVKGALEGLRDSGKMSYNDFYNIVDYLRNSGMWKEVADNMGIAADSAARDIDYFANTVVSASETIGKVDAKGFAKLGIDIGTAVTSMADGMNEGLKETARSQIRYLSGIEQMLEALLALEGIGDVELGLGIQIDTNGDGTDDAELTLDKILEYWEQIKNEPDLEKKIQMKLEELGDAGLNDLMKGLGAGDDFVKAFFGEDGFNLNNETERQMADAWGEIVAAIPNDVFSNLTEGQAITLGQQMRTALSEYMIFDKESGDFIGMKKGWETALKNWIKGADFSNIPEALNIEVQNQINQALSKVEGIELTDAGGIKIKDFDPEKGLSQDLANQIITAYEAQGLDVGDLEVDAQGNVTVKFVNKATKAYIDGDGGWSKVQSDIQNGLQTIYQKEIDFDSEVQGKVNVKVNVSTGTFTMESGGASGDFGDAFDDSTGTWNIAKLEELIEAQMGPISDLTINGEGEGATFSFKLDIQTPDTTALTTIASDIGSIKDSLTNGFIMTVDSSGAQNAITQVQTVYEGVKKAIENNPITMTVNATGSEINQDGEGGITGGTTVGTSEQQIHVTWEVETPPAVTTPQTIDVDWNLLNSAPSVSTPQYIDVWFRPQNSPPSAGGGNGPGPFAGTMNGLAFANGSLGRLHSGAVLANKALVGELGPELAVYDGQYHMLGANGAEFVDLPSDAIIFNHLQTQGILRGQMNIRGTAMAEGNVTGPAFAGGGIGAALSAVRRAKSVWQGLLNSLSAADLMGAGGGGGGGGGDNNSLKAHIEDLQEWYNLSRQIAKIEQEINTLLAKRKNITDGHEYLKNLRETQKLLTQQVATQQVLVKYQQAQLEAQAQHINTHSIWSQFLTVGEDGLLQYKDGNETNGGKGSLSVLQQMNQMSGEEQVAFLAKLGYSYTDNDGNKLEGEELVAKFFEELQKQIDDYDALADAVAEAEEAMADLEAEIAEIEREIRDNEIELGQNIYDVMVAAWEENIKNLKEQNELIKEANEAYANGIQEAIDAERQMYEQNKAISDREQLQRQLALLRRSGGSASEIADLESQLDDMLKDEYFANQEDALETIRDANERQVELMDQQVKLQEEALEYEKENGVIWTKVYEVMQGTDAEILSFLSGNDPGFFEKQKLEQEDMLTEWAKKIGIYTEERQRQNYIKELDTNSFNNALVSADGKIDYTSTYNKLDDSEKKTLKDLFERTYGDARIDGKSEAEALKLANKAVQKFLEDWKKAQDAASKPSSSSGGSSGGNSGNSSGGSSKKADYHYIKVGDKFIGVNSSGSKSSIVSYIARASGLSKEEVEKQLKTSKRYASGGLVNYTGPAWVDGSRSKPERILSAEQNKILEEGLAMNAGRSDKLREMFSNFAENLGASVRASISNIINRTSGSAITIQPGAVQLNIEQLNDKYDVDELFNDVADRLYSIASKASGRGVNRR